MVQHVHRARLCYTASAVFWKKTPQNKQRTHPKKGFGKSSGGIWCSKEKGAKQWIKLSTQNMNSGKCPTAWLIPQHSPCMPAALWHSASLLLPWLPLPLCPAGRCELPSISEGCYMSVHLQCHSAPQLDWSVHATFQQTRLGAQDISFPCMLLLTPAPWCLLQPVLSLPCLQPHTLVLVAYEGETVLQRNTGFCPSLSWG